MDANHGDEKAAQLAFRQYYTILIQYAKYYRRGYPSDRFSKYQSKKMDEKYTLENGHNRAPQPSPAVNAANAQLIMQEIEIERELPADAPRMSSRRNPLPVNRSSFNRLTKKMDLQAYHKRKVSYAQYQLALTYEIIKLNAHKNVTFAHLKVLMNRVLTNHE